MDDVGNSIGEVGVILLHSIIWHIFPYKLLEPEFPEFDFAIPLQVLSLECFPTCFVALGVYESQTMHKGYLCSLHIYLHELFPRMVR